jgi:hypothetical protein
MLCKETLALMYTDIQMESTRASSRKNRVYIFREFIWDVYDDYLSKGDIVLDAAGGKGDLSWLLKNVDDVDSVVADPRVTNNHIVKSVRFLQEHPAEATLRAILDRPTYQPLAALMPKLEAKENLLSSRHLRILVDEDLVCAIRSFSRGEANGIETWTLFWNGALEKGLGAQPLGHREDETRSDGEITDAKDALGTILSAKLIVGFHPDQATGASIDLAMELGIPFCVVPCCVFPAEFPDRKLVDGTRVRCHTQLIEYLKTKNPMIQTAALNFHFTETAKNLVLYTRTQQEGSDT